MRSSCIHEYKNSSIVLKIKDFGDPPAVTEGFISLLSKSIIAEVKDQNQGEKTEDKGTKKFKGSK